MGEKYQVGDKVITTERWSNGMGYEIPAGSTVEITRLLSNQYDGHTYMYECRYKHAHVTYAQQWLGDVMIQPGKLNEVKELLIEARVELAKAKIPSHHCPKAYYSGWECPEDLSESGDCTACKTRFFNQLEKQIREEVMVL